MDKDSNNEPIYEVIAQIVKKLDQIEERVKNVEFGLSKIKQKLHAFKDENSG